MSRKEYRCIFCKQFVVNASLAKLQGKNPEKQLREHQGRCKTNNPLRKTTTSSSSCLLSSSWSSSSSEKVKKLFQIGRHALVDDGEEVDFQYDNHIARSYLDELKIYELQDEQQIDALITDPSFCLKSYCLQFIELLKKWKEFGELAKDDSSTSDVSTIVSRIQNISDKYSKISNFSYPLILTHFLSSCYCCCSYYYYLLGFTKRFLS